MGHGVPTSHAHASGGPLRTLVPALLLTGLAACAGSEPWEVEHPPLELSIHSPAYGAFLGEGPIEVSGRISDPTAMVWVEGRAVNVGTDGSFRVQVPFNRDYRVIDVEASSPLDRLRERVPVFKGADPLETWPGALSMRIGQSGLASLAKQLGELIDSQVGDIFRWPTLVELTPSDDGLLLLARLRRAYFDLEFQGIELGLGIDEVALGATALPEVDADGMLALTLTDTTVELGRPTLHVAGFSPTVIEDLLEGVLSSFAGVIDGILDGLIGSIGTIPLGGPIDFQTDLLGSPLHVSVDDLWTDPHGIAGRVGVQFEGDPPTVEIPAPGPWVGHARSDLSLAVHEGLFQRLLASEMLEMLEQDLELPGPMGNILSLPIRALPGGQRAPQADAWCVKVRPGDARAARLQHGTAPLATLYLPDLQFTVGYTEGSRRCQDWLVANLELAVDVSVKQGTKLDLDLRVPGGAVLAYATDAGWQEPEVIAGLGGLMDTLMSLMGGALDLDLADLFGGGLDGDAGGLPLGALEPRVIASEPILDANGQPIDGLFAVSLKLWR